MDAALDVDALRGWVGRRREAADTATPQRIAALAATLDREGPPPALLPPLWHWTLFHDATPQRELGADGHARRGGFLPPVPLPRRMWAGGRIEFRAPVRAGDTLRRVSTLRSVEVKEGRSGALAFVTVEHAIDGPDGPALREEHDIVYRGLPRAGAAAPAPQPAPAAADFSRQATADPVLLFRYSALTFNGHRIHYDRRHATEVEGYPGLVVHGPLVATLLVELLLRERPGVELARFEFRALQPLFDTAPFGLHGRVEADGRATLWASAPDGTLAMRAVAFLR